MLEQASAERYQKHEKSARLNYSKIRRRHQKEKLFQSEVHKIVDHLMQEVLSKLNSGVEYAAEKTAIDATKTYDVDRNKAFIKSALSSTLN